MAVLDMARRPLTQFDDKDFSRNALNGLEIVGRTVRNARFDGASLRNATFERSTFLDCSFVGAVLDGSRLAGAVFENCDFTGAHLVKVDARDAVFRTAQVLNYAGRRGDSMDSEPVVSFDGATIANSTFTGARLTRASMHNVRATNVDFRDADLAGAKFEGCTIAGSQFAGAKLDGADFSQTEDAREALPGWARNLVVLLRRPAAMDLVKAIRRHEEWLKTNGGAGERLARRALDISRARLDGRDLSGCSLRDCRLDFASLRNARLITADLRGTSFIKADLTGADLRQALIDPDALTRAVGADPGA
jgi:uncharacterized protein YjbI with pentapeptide repeats